MTLRNLLVFATLGAAAAQSLTRRDDGQDGNADYSDIYPPYNATGGSGWQSAYQKARKLVSQMTLEEKANLTTGVNGPCAGQLGSVERLGLNFTCLQDGPAGPRPVPGTSQFPAGLSAAATWDRDLIYSRAKAIGQEFYDQGIHIALGPVTGGPLGRSPRGGRNWEGWFADPYASGVASYLSVKGMQDSGVRAVAKHYIGYEQDTFRDAYDYVESYDPFPEDVQSPINSIIDDKTTHEIYLWSFAEAVRAGTSHVMCSYNEVNGTHACNNAYTLNHLLKAELNFQGSIVTDWGGQHNGIPSALGGLDISMPGTGSGGWASEFWLNFTELVNNGSIPEWRVDDMVIRTLTPYYALGQDTKPLPPIVWNANSDFYDGPNGYRNVMKSATKGLIREIGHDGIVLLKNTGVLPLSKPGRIAVIGTDAGDGQLDQDLCGATFGGCEFWINNGTLTLGGGSGWTSAPYVVTPLDALKTRAIEDNSEIQWILRDNDNSSIQSLAPISDVTLVFVNQWVTEGQDRQNLTFDHDGEGLIAAAVNSSSNVVIVMHIAGVMDIERWVDHPNVTAIVAAWLPGQESGNSLVKVLYGDVNPSGKLPFTWGKSESDYPPNTIIADPVVKPVANFTEGVFIDYRWFDQKNITPRYEFGYGLSYTTFEFSDLTYDDTVKSDDTTIMTTAEPFAEYDGSNSLYDVLATYTVTVKNTGKVKGSEVAQLYVSFPVEGEPVKVLRGFDKVKDLEAGKSGKATFELRRKDLSVWSVEKQHWYVPEGKITIAVGSSSRNLPLTTTYCSSD